jgi:hypothetical protein
VDGVATAHDTDGLVEALRQWAAARRPGDVARLDSAGDLS